MYFNDAFPAEYGITVDTTKANTPHLVLDEAARQGLSEAEFTAQAAQNVVKALGLAKR